MIRSVPIYDYHCDACGHSFSAVRSYTDGPVEKCPNCGERPRRLISTPAIVFKGSGWYKTDSRGAAPKESGDTTKASDKSAAGSGTSETKSDSKSESKSESKTETKSETKSESKPASDAPTKSEAKS
jgi:putative FmdB family regulatory protein